MEFLKKHYEKVVMGVVLLGLVVGAASLPLMISGERESLRTKADEIIKRKVNPLPPLELAKQEMLLQRVQTPFALDFSTTNRLFNPMLWRKRPDGTPIKDLPRNIGPEAMLVTKNTPLYLIISLDSVSTASATPHYIVGVVREAAVKSTDRSKKQKDATPGNKNDTFVIREVRGPADNPTELVIELNDTGEQALVAKDRPFKRVDGYMADLKYPPENNRAWANQRVGSQLKFEGEDYIVVAINKNEVVLSAKSNNKKTSIPYIAGL